MIRRTATQVSIACALALLLAAPTLNAAPSDAYLVLPGRQLGRVIIGYPASAYLNTWGPPDSTEKGTMTTYEYSRYKLTLVTFVDTVLAAETSDDSYYTDEGIRVGSTVEQVVAAYGRNYKLTTGSTTSAMAFGDIGLTVGIRGGRVTALRVFSTGDLLAKLMKQGWPRVDGCSYVVVYSSRYLSRLSVTFAVNYQLDIQVFSVTWLLKVFRYKPGGGEEVFGKELLTMYRLEPKARSTHTESVLVSDYVPAGQRCDLEFVSWRTSI